MKVELVVVQGNPEGKRIHLTIPVFRIGRGETCHLRPNSERVSREHAEFAVKDSIFTVRDLGSRNGTLVNGKPIEELTVLARGDQVTVGPLTFAVAFDGDHSPATAAPAPAAAPAAKASAPANDIASWLFDEKPAEEKPSGVYGGETITINAFKSTLGASASSGITEAAKMDDQGFERQTEGDDEETETPDEFMDEDNPFNVKKKPAEASPSATAAPSKEPVKDTSDAASAILRRMMERSKED